MDVPLQFSPTILFILLLFNWQIWPEWILTHDTLGALHAKKDVPFQLLPSWLKMDRCSLLHLELLFRSNSWKTQADIIGACSYWHSDTHLQQYVDSDNQSLYWCSLSRYFNLNQMVVPFQLKPWMMQSRYFGDCSYWHSDAFQSFNSKNQSLYWWCYDSIVLIDTLKNF